MASVALVLSSLDVVCVLVNPPRSYNQFTLAELDRADKAAFEYRAFMEEPLAPVLNEPL